MVLHLHFRDANRQINIVHFKELNELTHQLNQERLSFLTSSQSSSKTEEEDYVPTPPPPPPPVRQVGSS